MAFSFSNAVSGSGGFGGKAQTSTGVQVRDGPELQEIQTDQIGFSAINGDAKVRLLPSPWPTDSLPPPTSSLLSIASSKGFLAAAGPDTLVLASTESVRSAFSADVGHDSNIKTFQPEIKVSVPRLSQVSFSADENVLVVSPQEGGGLVIYKVDALKNGKLEPALQIATNNTGLRALIPNPVPDSAELFAVVTTNGELLMADLKSGQLRPGSNGPILMLGVSCLSWSNKGTQLVAGLADGTATQMKPDGTVVTQIPKSPSIPGNMHLSSISWLENDSFFVVYTPNDTTSDGMMPSSEYYIISRQSDHSDYIFQKLPELCPPFGLERLPSFHFITRLRHFSLNLQDLLIVTSTTSIDLGLLSKSKVPLSKEEPVTGVFTLTTINDDTRRAQIPLSESSGDLSAIGVGLDLSSKDVVGNPIPSDPEIQFSATPLPNLLVLTHEGILVSWWVVYNESIREKTAFSGLVSAAGSHQNQKQTSSTPVQSISAQALTTNTTSTFGQSGFATSSTFAKPAPSPFAAPAVSSAVPTFGSGFGTKATIGGGGSSWTSTGFGSNATPQSGNSGFAKIAFGSATPIGGVATSAFGAPASLVSRQSLFGQTPVSAISAFGAAASSGPFMDTPAQSPFAAAGGSSSSGFAGFSGSNGFSKFGSEKTEGKSVFGQGASNSFSNPGKPSIFGGQTDKQSVFGGQTPDQGKSMFIVDAGSAGFKIQSTFRGDGSAKDDLPKPIDSGGFGFGGKSFEDLLGEPNKNAQSPTHDTEAEMDEKEDGEVDEDTSEASRENMPNQSNASQQIVTPPSTIIHHKTTPGAPLSSLFGASTQPQTTTPVAQKTIAVGSQNASAGWSFGDLPSTTPKDTPGPSHLNLFGITNQDGTTPAVIQQSESSKNFGFMPQVHPEKHTTSSKQQSKPEEARKAPQIKAEPPSDDESSDLRNIPEIPLPPEPSSKSTYSPGDTSVSSDNSRLLDDATLPPDFVPPNKIAATSDEQPEPPEGDDDESSSDFEGSEEDITEEISPIDEPPADETEQLLTSPESSFGRSEDKSDSESPTGGLFTKITSTQPKKSIPRTLFGEIGSGGPIFPPPKPQESPRSPSPIRNVLRTDLLRPDAPRSFSAPTRPPVLEKRKAELAKSLMAAHAAREKEDRASQEEARAEAIVRAHAQAEAEAAPQLEDDEDERLRSELEAPVEPCPILEAFLPHQPVASDEMFKSGIPGQIERLYQDINSMIVTLGINVRSLSAFMDYQQNPEHDKSGSFSNILKSETPMDALDQEWLLEDILGLPAGEAVLTQGLATKKLSNVASKLQQCQTLLGKEIADLRSKLVALRKSVNVRADPALSISAPLSPEQSLTQQELRKASTAVQTRLTQVEESLSVLRAKLAEMAPPHDKNGGGRGLVRTASQKKPTVEAVTNTIAKMTSMAEKKSADIDVLEAQLKKLNVNLSESMNGSRQASVEPNGTPRKGGTSTFARLTGSAANSVYHTPDSKFSGSVRSTPGTSRQEFRSSINRSSALVSAEDREIWQAKAQRKKEVASLLREALAQKRSKARLVQTGS